MQTFGLPQHQIIQSGFFTKNKKDDKHAIKLIKKNCCI